jgi:hypothetical protein
MVIRSRTKPRRCFAKARADPLPVVRSGDPSGFVSSASRRLRLDLACLARFDVMAPPTQLAENACFEYLALERFQRPIESISVAENYFRHEPSMIG